MYDYQWDFQQLSAEGDLSNQRLTSLPDTCFWKSRLQNMLDYKKLWGEIGLVNQGVYIFSGPVGSGRHMTGTALIGELPGYYGLSAEKTLFLMLRAEDFPETMSPEEATAQVYAIFDTVKNADEQGEKITEGNEKAFLSIIVFDAMDHYAHLQTVSNAIADCVSGYSSISSELVVICYVEDELVLSFDLRSMGLILRTNNPSDRQREDFLRAGMKWEHPNLELPGQMNQTEITLEGISMEELVTGTQGLSYKDLSLFVLYVRLTALSRSKNEGGLLKMFCDKISVLDCLDIVRNQKRKETGQIVQLQQMVESGQNSAVAASANVSDDRIESLTNKSDRTFEENLELIQGVMVSGGTENEN